MLEKPQGTEFFIIIDRVFRRSAPGDRYFRLEDIIGRIHEADGSTVRVFGPYEVHLPATRQYVSSTRHERFVFRTSGRQRRFSSGAYRWTHLESRRITIAGITRHPTETWMEQMARNVTDESTGCLRDIRYVLHDRDSKFCASFESILTAVGVKPLKLPARSPNLNAFAERWVRSAREECLSKLILFGETSLKRALAEFVEHFHAERPHQGKGNVLLFPTQGLQ
jgi:transposase InsO family protein